MSTGWWNSFGEERERSGPKQLRPTPPIFRGYVCDLAILVPPHVMRYRC